jgi:hypothetical protein
MHHQSSEQQQITCGCFNDPTGMTAGEFAVLPGFQSLLTSVFNPRVVPGLDEHAPDFTPAPISPPPR